MNPTDEQLAIININEDSKINATAGSGKTTTLIEFSKSKNPKEKILYLVFNKSAKIDAQSKFLKRGVYNVTIETAHSLAFSEIVRGRGYKVVQNDYKPNELVELLGINVVGSHEPNINYIVATHVYKMMSMFCNSDIRKLNEFNYLNSLTSEKARDIVSINETLILDKFKLFWTLMNDKKIDITHDFYLKKYQLSNPVLNYDYILFDEGQDTSGVMLDIFNRQSGMKIIVGDTHQQIYSWRYAVNSLEKMNFKTYELTRSFRFNQNIANLANSVLNLKNILLPDSTNSKIIGCGGTLNYKTHAVIARTNISLLIKAIEYCGGENSVDRIFFEGNLSSYTYASEGTSLYDVLNLFLNKRTYIRDSFIREIGGFNELEEFAESVEDGSLKMLIDIVKEYGASIPQIIKKIKSKNVEFKEEAEIIFTTVHKSKGIEYDSVELADDFIRETDIKKLKENTPLDKLPYKIPYINEELNMLYVALTRTTNRLYIPKTLVPFDYIPTGNIFVLSRFGDLKNEARIWSEKDDELLTAMNRNKVPINKISKSLKRSERNINLRLKELENNEK